MAPPGILFIVSAPSGGGKTTVSRQLMQVVDNLVPSVSYTTRPPRAEETESQDYFFVSPERFEELASQGFFAEWAWVHGWRYGTPARFLQECQGQDVVLTLDVQGAKTLRDKYHHVVMVFLLPPSFAELKERLLRRGTEGNGELQERLRAAQEEIKEMGKYHYLIVNREVEETVKLLAAIVTAERLRPWRIFWKEEKGLVRA